MLYLFRLSLAALLCVTALGQSAGLSDEVDFGRDIRPLLSDRCFHCHGPDAGQRQGDFRLDLREGAFADLGGYRALVPGDLDASELIRRITAEDEDERMPPADSNRRLSAAEIDLLKRWVAEGAKWDRHWSFQPVERPPVPETKSRGWSNDEIDQFVLARLEAAGLKPAPEAGRERLIRRLSFDLTGLPPTLAEIDAFLADDQPAAYERLVDRLLASPRFGERLASLWLDAARYSDTYGYQVDRDRRVWPWRDWVIAALNENMPYDLFIQNQLAGDLFPQATLQQRLATTFNRLHPQKTEGGSDPEEFRTEYVADRVQTLATAVLGLTMECCRCHDHKYDPITQKEFYQLFAFFNNIDEFGLYSYSTKSVPTPTLRLPTAAQEKQLAEARRRVAEQTDQLAEILSQRQAAFEQWLQGADRVPGADQQSSEKSSELVPGRIASLDFEGAAPAATEKIPGPRGDAVQLNGDSPINTQVGDFRRYDPFTISLWLRTPDEKKRAVIFHRSLGWTDAGSRGYELLLEEGKLSAALVHFWPGNAIRIRTQEKIVPAEWTHVAMVYDGSSTAAGLRLYLNGQQAVVDVVRDCLNKEIAGADGDPLALGARGRDRGFRNGGLDEFQVYPRQLSPLEVDHLAGGSKLAHTLEKTAAELSTAERDALWHYYLRAVDRPYGEQLAALREARATEAKVHEEIVEIMVMRELAESRPAYFLNRGAYDQRGPRVAPQTPAVFPPFPEDQPSNRLGLARWLTDGRHPLTARVAVNRFWQMLFGEGLVRTPEDFGSQGALPTHPELLDYLATEFVDSGWDIKRLLKKIVCSATYRQSSEVESELLERDPENQLLARAARYQLPAEMLRDAALAAGGLLVERIGGPPVKPYEVAVSFKPVERDTGEGLYRRSLYTYWKRTGPAPVMMALDASKRDVCRVRRSRTSSPLQALVLLNDPQFVEAGRHLSQKLIREHGTDDAQVLSAMFRTLSGRHPTADDRAVLEELYQQQLAFFENHQQQAEHYLQTGDAAYDNTLPPARLAAHSVVATTLLNYEGFTMKR
jgi:hypothetical protein